MQRIWILTRIEENNITLQMAYVTKAQAEKEIERDKKYCITAQYILKQVELQEE